MARTVAYVEGLEEEEERTTKERSIQTLSALPLSHFSSALFIDQGRSCSGTEAAQELAQA